MSSDTRLRDQIDEAATEGAPDGVRPELTSGADMESLVLAYRNDGELTERSVPAAAARHGDLT